MMRYILCYFYYFCNKISNILFNLFYAIKKVTHETIKKVSLLSPFEIIDIIRLSNNKYITQ